MTDKTPRDLRQQAMKCKTNCGAAILCSLATWMEGREATGMPAPETIEGLEPWEFVDLWAKPNEEQRQ